MKFPYRSIISIDRNSEVPVYLQLANSLILAIRRGTLKQGSKLPGTRDLAGLLKLHRNTVIAAFDELQAQGWIEIVPVKGSFVSSAIPEINSKEIKRSQPDSYKYPAVTGYVMQANKHIGSPGYLIKNDLLELDDGLPDVRIAPLEALTRTYRSVALRFFRQHRQHLGYTGKEGNRELREALSKLMGTTRGLQAKAENIHITRGSQMALYLIVNTLIAPGDNVIAGSPGYLLMNSAILNRGATLLNADVDSMGIVVDQVEAICKKRKIRAVYVTSHHHYPTTVTLSADRRVQLLALAEKYNFCIIEDDYDYDFHYSGGPVLPIASSDTKGMVIYVGSFSKSIAPVMRIGYIVAPVNLINETLKHRRIMDVQGDAILEKSMAELIAEGEIKRHMKKALLEYRGRRDFFCTLLQKHLRDKVQFKIPEGGMAAWVKFDKSIKLDKMAEKALNKGLLISNGTEYNWGRVRLNTTRMGFASVNFNEIERAIEILTKCI